MKNNPFFYFPIFAFFCFLAVGRPYDNNVYQGGKSKILQSDSMETQCLNRMQNFIKWYKTHFLAHVQLRDTSISILKEIRMHGKDVLRIDTLGCEEYVDSYYKSGYFTDSWRERNLKRLLATDKILAKRLVNDWGELYDIKVLNGDPVLGYQTCQDCYDTTFTKWEVRNCRPQGKEAFSIDLISRFASSGNENRWTFRIILEGGQLKIDSISTSIREEHK